jgi:hypothetical protein
MVHGMRSLGHITSFGIVIQRMQGHESLMERQQVLTSSESLNILRGVIEVAGNHPEFHKRFTRNRLIYEPYRRAK